jgi:broad specificity phosphatase PhoE
MTLLYCIRHGQSTYNALGRIQGQSDVPLSELGRRQALAVARALADAPIEAIYSSPLRRAKDTARLLADLLGLDVREDPRLKEVDVGVFTDRLRDEVLEEYPGAISRWRSGRLDFVFPEGESRRDLIRRGHEVLDEIRRAGHRQAAVVAHGGVLLAAMKAMLAIPSDHPPHSLENASISTLLVNGDGQAERVELDNTDHLAAEDG